MDINNEPQPKIIELGKIVKLLYSKRRTFIKVWVVTFILACAIILPQPRYYICDVKLAPETGADNAQGSLSAIASNFGFNIGGMASSDAIYPILYPDLFESPEFVTKLFDIRVHTIDGTVDADYYTYLTQYQKSNVLLYPFKKVKDWAVSMFGDGPTAAGNGHNPFMLNKVEYGVLRQIQSNINCIVDKKTDVITLSVKDQDPLVVATLADSVMYQLQKYIIDYRTKKARADRDYYQQLADSSRAEFLHAQKLYSDYCDSHRVLLLQSSISERDMLENEMAIKLSTYQAMMTQLQAMKAKVQESTPAFTTLQTASVPIKPAGPKRMIFVVAMLILSSVLTSIWVYFKDSHQKQE